MTTADRRLQLILENTTAVMYLKDTEGRYVFVNAEYERLFDRESEAFVGRTDHEVHPPRTAEEVWENDRRVLETGAPIEAEERIDVDGKERTYLSLKVPATNDAGEVEGVFGVSTDITDRKERERQLEALNHAIRRLLSADSREQAAEWGVEAAQEILGLRASAIHLYDEASEGLVPVAETDELSELVDETPTFTAGDSTAWRVYETGEAIAVDDVRDDPDVYNPETVIRSELYVPLGSYGILIAGSPTPSRFDSQDVTVGELLAAHLVSAFNQLDHERQLRAREAELERQNERLDQFSSMVSHDLRNPISIATGHLELYRDGGEESDLDRVEQSLDRIGELVADLTTIARHSSIDGEREIVSLSEVAEDAWDMVDTRSATLSTTEGTVTGDRSQLQGLFENLFRNAVGHGGADVTVRVGPLDDGFYVEDTGSGIPPEDRGKVFEQGFSTGYGGSGVGLTIVSRIAEAHGFAASLSESAEGGARFEFRDTKDEASVDG